MKIKFYAHACFRLEGDGLAVITDPYTPGPGGSQFEPVDEPADIVLMSSATDTFHSDPSHIQGGPMIINALEIPPEGRTIKGLHLRSFDSMESLTYDYGRDPDANAMYLFTLDGLRILHLGDIGNPVAKKQLQALHGNVDIMFALTGDQPTITLDDLETAIQAIEPRVIIPMHYYHPRGRLKILPVTAFTDRQPAGSITWVGGSELTLTSETLPAERHIYVLEQCR